MSFLQNSANTEVCTVELESEFLWYSIC